MNYFFSEKTDIGLKRETNQDSITVVSDKNLFVVADGMGGHNGGDIASQMCCKLFKEFSLNNSDLSPEEIIKEGIEYINQSIYNHGQENKELIGMGTTVNCLILDQQNAYFGNVGDSRAYLLSGENLYQITRDHSLVQQKIYMGIYNRVAGKNDVQKNILVRTVGFEPNVEVDLYTYKVHKGDLFILCSDGLHGKVSDSDMRHIILETFKEFTNDPQKALDVTNERLIKLANDNGGQDNISVILVQI